MIQQESHPRVADSTGAREIQYIRVLGGSIRRFTSISGTIVATVKEATPSGNVKADEVAKAVTVHAKRKTRHLNGSYISFDENAAVVIKTNGESEGIRISGLIARELRDKRFVKVVLSAPKAI